MSCDEHDVYEIEDSLGDAGDIRLSHPDVEADLAAYHLDLRVVETGAVVPHEHYHALRVAGLAERLQTEGTLINPPIVAQRGDRYVVLDGATRATAMRQLGYSHIIVQVVDIEADEIQLTSWKHVVYGGSCDALLALLQVVDGVELVPVAGDVLRDRGGLRALAHLIVPDQRRYVVALSRGNGTQENHGDWLDVLNAVVGMYGEWGNVERTLSMDVAKLASQFPSMAALVSFPRFSLPTILSLAAQGRTVPAGITRFVIPGRILRLNAPLAKLASDESLADKQRWLDALLREKLLARRVRYYEEPVVLLDE